MQHKSVGQPYIIYKSHTNEIMRDITIINGQPYYRSTGHNSGMEGTWLPFVMLRGTELSKALSSDPDSQLTADWKQIAENYFQKNTPVPRINLPRKFEVTNSAVLKRIEKRKLTLSNKEYQSESKNVNENEICFLKLFSHLSYPYYELENIYIHQVPMTYIIKYNYGIVNHTDTSLDINKIHDTLENLSKGKYGKLGRIICKEHLIVSMRLGGGIWLNPETKTLLMNAANIKTSEINSAQYADILLNPKPAMESRDPDVINQWLILNGARDIFEIYKLNEVKVGFLREIITNELTFKKMDELKLFTLSNKKQVKNVYKAFFTLIDDILSYQLPHMHSGEFLQDIVTLSKNINIIVVSMIVPAKERDWHSLWHKSAQSENVKKLGEIMEDIGRYRIEIKEYNRQYKNFITINQF